MTALKTWAAWLCMTAAAATSSCAAVAAPLTGDWGNSQLQVIATHGGATLEFACGHGAISTPIQVDASGRFEVEGSFTPGRPGPAVWPPPPGSGPRPARFRGHIDNGTLHLQMDVSGPNGFTRDYRLERGIRLPLTKCL